DFGLSLGPTRGRRGGVLVRRWADYVAALAVEVGARVSTPDGPEALDRLFRERENLLAAQEWGIGAGDPGLAARILLAAARAFAARAPWQLRRDRLLDAIQALADRDPASRVRLLIELADTWWSIGAYSLAFDPANTAVEEAGRVGDDGLRAAALHVRGEVASHRADRGGAAEDFAAGLSLAERAGDPRLRAKHLAGLSGCHTWQGRGAEARDAVRLLREVGDDLGLARAVNQFGLVLWRNGDPAGAGAAFREAEMLERRFGNLRLVAGRLTNRGLALTDLDQLPEALALFAEADVIHADQGNRPWRAVNAAGWGLALLRHGRPAEAEARLREHLSEPEAAQYPENVALLAGNLARVLFAAGRAAEAEPHVARASDFQLRTDGGRHRRYWGNLDPSRRGPAGPRAPPGRDPPAGRGGDPARDRFGRDGRRPGQPGPRRRAAPGRVSPVARTGVTAWTFTAYKSRAPGGRGLAGWRPNWPAGRDTPIRGPGSKTISPATPAPSRWSATEA
ncbi:MAG TPA: hypothetical protein VH092_33735, partial [Urbifossiella sp.]|nr:hypothetical protein [Urbifossiella sp.]